MLLMPPPRPRRAATVEATTASVPFESRITGLFGPTADEFLALEAPDPAGRPTQGDGESDPRTARTDEQLLADHRAGVPGAFDRLIGRYRDDLFHFILRFVKEPAAAEDVFQDTFLRVHQFADHFDAGRAFRPWLYSIAANGGRDVIRTRGRHGGTASLQAPLRSGDGRAGGELADLLPADADAPDHRMETAEVCGRVRALLAAMPKHLRQILQLSYFQQFDYDEISQALDIPLGTVKSRLNAAVAHFAGRWQERHGSECVGPRRAARARRRSPKRPAPPAAAHEQQNQAAA